MNAQTHALNVTQLAIQAEDWEAVYQELMPRVYNFFRYRTGGSDNALAEDLTAMTFMKAWRFRAQYSDDLGAFSTWLFTIAQNVARDHFRRQHDDVPLDALPHLADNHEDNVEAAVEMRSDLKRLAVLLEMLNGRERELVALKYGAELTNRAIAEMTGLSESNVGTILHRVVQKLRASWDGS